MPGSGEKLSETAQKVLTEPIFEGLLPGAIMEGFRPARGRDLEDESVGSFLQRRFGNPNIADNLVSAIMHGIYAGDIYQLSVRSLMPGMWWSEGQFGSLTRGFMKAVFDGDHVHNRRDLLEWTDPAKTTEGYPRKGEMRTASVYTLKGGIESLSNALVAALKANPKVGLKSNEKVKRISFDRKTNSIRVRPGSPRKQYSH
jgi:oxygen-dependent protoporphyrinogen oxidase